MLNLLSGLFRPPAVPARPRPLGEASSRSRAAAIPRAGAAPEAIRAGAAVCPTEAIGAVSGRVDLGRCVMCGRCREVAPGAFTAAPTPLLAATARAVLAAGPGGLPDGAKALPARLEALAADVRRALGRSLHVREVDAGSCNGCEWEVVALTGPDYDLQHLGIDLVASPRHADLLLVTGPPTRQMAAALLETYEATPDPRLVVALGACAVSGGVFTESYACLGGVAEVVPVDVFIPGCPPRPEAIVEGLLLAAGRLAGLSAK